tara:strand:- start:338 stop:553 length:216 start_codon:yes stop_codon:yes gene_type:complete
VKKFKYKGVIVRMWRNEMMPGYWHLFFYTTDTDWFYPLMFGPSETLKGIIKEIRRGYRDILKKQKEIKCKT